MDLPTQITSIEGTPDGLIFDTNSNQHLTPEFWIPTHAQIFQHACRLCKPTKFLPGPQKPIDPRPLVSFSKETPRGKVKSCDCHLKVGMEAHLPTILMWTLEQAAIHRQTHAARMMMNHNLPWWRTFILTVPDPEEIPLFHSKCCHIWFCCSFPVPCLCGERARPGSNQRFPCGYHGPGGKSWPLQVL